MNQMERIRERLRGSNVGFFGLIATSWLVFLAWDAGARELLDPPIVIFGLGAMLLSTWILHLMDYFTTLRVLPRKSDLLLVFTSVPIAGVLQNAVMTALFHRCPVSLLAIWLGSPVAAVLVFGARHLYAWRNLRAGSRKRVALDLLPAEREALIQEFGELGLEEYVEFLDHQTLMGSVLKRRLREIDQIVISRGAVRSMEAKSYLVSAHLAGVPIVDRRELSASLTGRIRLNDSDSWSFVLTATQQTPILTGYAKFKVVAEPVIATALAVLLLPLMLAIAVAIRLEDRGAIFYSQERVGYLGKSFRLIKFRSMRDDSEQDGPQWARAADDRVTRVGKLLRATRLDELPQLWNIIRGEMSFFGPRPERPEFCRILAREIPLFSMRTVIRPGISGWAQVCAGYAASIEESRTKLEYDLYYIKHVSPRLDMVILAKTLLVALMGSERAQARPGLRPAVAVAAAAASVEPPPLPEVTLSVLADVVAREMRSQQPSSRNSAGADQSGVRELSVEIDSEENGSEELEAPAEVALKSVAGS